MLWRSALPRPTSFALAHQHPLIQWLLLILMAGSAGQLFKYFHVPAALFLGPMLVAIGFGVAGASIRLNKHVFRLGQGAVGVLVAHSMTVGVLLAAMQSLGAYDTGGFTVTYSATQRHGSSYVELGMVSREGKLRG